MLFRSRIAQDQAPEHVGVLERKDLADHPAHRDSYEVGLCNAEAGEESVQVIRHLLDALRRSAVFFENSPDSIPPTRKTNGS